MAGWKGHIRPCAVLVAAVGCAGLWGCLGPLRGGARVLPIGGPQAESFANAERQLQSVDPRTRHSAAVALLSMGHPRALQAVLDRLLDDSDPVLRISMIKAAAFCVDHRCFEALLEAVKDPDEETKEAAASALCRFSRLEEVRAGQRLASDPSTTRLERELLFHALGEGLFVQAVPVLLEGLESNDEGTREAAWKALVKISGRQLPPEPNAWASWWEVNQHRKREDVLERRVRELSQKFNVISALNKQLREQFDELAELVRRPDSETPKALLEALNSPYPGVRDYAAMRLASMEPNALKGISLDDQETYGLFRTTLRDQATDVRENIVRLIVSLKGRFRDRLLLMAMEDQSPSVLLQAIEVANRDMGAAALLRLKAALESPHPEVREAAANALGKLGFEEAIPALMRALQDQEEDVRWFAVEGLRKLNATQAVPRLCSILERDASMRVREITASTLGELGQPAAIPSLRRALKSLNERVRTRAVSALKALARDDFERMVVIAKALSEHGLRADARDVLRKAIEEFDGKPEIEDQLVEARKELAEVLKADEDFAGAAAVYAELDTLSGGDLDVRRQLIECWLAAGETARIVPAMAQWLRAASAGKLAGVVDLGCEVARRLVRGKREDLARELAELLLGAARRSEDEALIRKVERLNIGGAGTGS